MKSDFLEKMVNSYSRVTAGAAIRAYIKIYELHESYQGEPPIEITDSWKALIDEAAVAGMGEVLEQIPFRTVSVGSEGAKEILVAGEAAPSVVGEFGKGEIMEAVSDAVEGTTLASRRQPGACSVIAVTKKPKEGRGLLETPKDIHYMLKFIGPPQAKGVVDLQIPHEENLKNLVNALNISPHDLTQVTFDPAKKGREANVLLVEAAKKVGVNLRLIDVGDFLPAIYAALDPKKFNHSPIIVVGRGGFEEGVMAAAAVKLLGGFMQAIRFNQDHVTYKNNPILTLEKDLVTGDINQTLVSATFITPEENWFNKPGVHQNGNKFILTTMLVTQDGVFFKKQEIKA